MVLDSMAICNETCGLKANTVFLIRYNPTHDRKCIGSVNKAMFRINANNDFLNVLMYSKVVAIFAGFPTVMSTYI